MEDQSWWTQYLQDLEASVANYKAQRPTGSGISQTPNEENVNYSILPQHVVAAQQKEVGKHPEVSSHSLLKCASIH